MSAKARAALATILAVASARSLNAEKRPLPDYDGRPEPTDAGDVALWIPRVALFPLYVVSEYLVREPLGWAVRSIELKLAGKPSQEKGHEHSSFGVVPSARLELHFKPSVGIYVFRDDFIASGNDLRLRAGFWGPDWLSFGAAERVHLGSVMVAAHGDFTRRPDYIFHGLGPFSREADRARYQAHVWQADLSLAVDATQTVQVTATAGLRGVSFRDGGCCDDPSLADQVAAGVLPAPPGFPDGYHAFFQRLEVILDSRPRHAERASGVRLAGHVEHDDDLRASDDEWLRYGGSVAGSLDLTGRMRVVTVSLAVELARPISGAVPFPELPTLGGQAALVGFPEGRLVGESTIAAGLRYEWPAWVWLCGTLAAEVGNSFGRDLDGFEPEALRLSVTVGLRSVGATDHRFQLLLGAGSDPFSKGAGLEAVRFAIGGTFGF